VPLSMALVNRSRVGFGAPRRAPSLSRSGDPRPARDTERAMSEENVEAYKRAVEAANRRDLEALLEELDPEVEWYSAVVGMGSEVYRRAEGIREMFRDADETIPDAFLEVSEIRDLGDRLLSFGRLRARGMESGAQTEAPFNQLVHFADGKATRLRTYLDPNEALEAAGLRE
jgi:ketosteroid isomerase-like protein